MSCTFRAAVFGLAIAALASPSHLLAEGVTTLPTGSYLCGPRSCGDWGPKGANTCRTCNQAVCTKNPTGPGEVVTGNKSDTECYAGHDATSNPGGPAKKPPEQAPITKKDPPRAQ